MVTRVKVSSRFQIAMPAEARKRLGIERGDTFLVEVRDRSIVLLPEPKDYAQALRGLHREVWDGVDVQEYIDHERDAWTG